MKININYMTDPELKLIDKIFQTNNRYLSLLSDVLNYNDKFINAKLIKDFRKDGNINSLDYSMLLSSIMNLDYFNDEDRFIINKYIIPATRKIDKSKYTNNSYYKNIHIPHKYLNNWRLTKMKYEPYQTIIVNDYVVDGLYEIPQIGYFGTTFTYPAVLENDNEWMFITPNEIETMQPALNLAYGKVITFGLGLGYFAYMASIKEDVEEVYVIERDANIIKLFEQYILPQFAYRNKIKVICEDAFIYAQEMKDDFDFVFVDLWHDVADGVPLYIRMKKIEKRFSKQFHYWIETSLISNIRYAIYIVLFNNLENVAIKTNHELVLKIENILKDIEINTIDEFKFYLTDEYILSIVDKL